MTKMSNQQASYLDTADGRRIAYHRSAGAEPGIVFLGGFMSDMQGTKALHLEAAARARGRAFLRFDYSGHGLASGAFDAGCISHWTADAMAAIAALTEGPQILIGSSMGGWIALLIAREMPERLAGLVTIAAAPDFTEDSMWAGFDARQRAELRAAGRILMPSAYDAPYTITRQLIEDGRQNLILRAPLSLPFPVRFLQGTADADVKMSVALALLEHAQGPDLRLTLVGGADHRFADMECLELIEATVDEVSARTGK